MNSELQDSCGIHGPVLKSIEAAEVNSWGHKKKQVSGMHLDEDKDVQQQVLWPHKALNANMVSSKPDYFDLSPSLFAAGAIGVVLSYMPKELTKSTTACMLQHLVRVLSYAETYTWKACLQVHHDFLALWEQRKKDWSSWDVVLDWHKLQLERLQGYKKSSKGNGGLSPEDKPKEQDAKKVEFGVEVSLIKASHLCLKFQRDNCEQEHDHDSPGGGKHKLAHHCAYCFLKAKPANSQAHSARLCEVRKAEVFAKRGGKGSTPA